MLNPNVVKNLRAAVLANPDLDSFEGNFIRKSRINIQQEKLVDNNPFFESPASVGRMRAPDHVFGSPVDQRCLLGISDMQLGLPPVIFRRMQNAVIIGNNVILGQNGSIFAADFVAENNYQQFLNQNNTNHQGFVAENINGDLYAYFAGSKASRTWGGVGLFLHNLEPGNYGSFLFRMLPQITYLKRLAFDFDYYVVPARTSWLLDAMRLLELPDKPMFTTFEISGDNLSEVHFFNQFDAEGFINPDSLAIFRQASHRLREGELGELKVYISRQLNSVARPSYRPLLNEKEVSQHFADHNFLTVYPETLSFRQQVSLFSRASCIAGPSGSGMLNAVFAPPNSKVLDLESFTFTVRQHAKIYASSEKRFAFLFGHPEPIEPLFLAPWTVDMHLVQRATSWLLEE